MTSPPIVYVESDFATPQETLREYHRRVAPIHPRDWFCIALIALGAAVSFGAAVWVFFLLAVIA